MGYFWHFARGSQEDHRYGRRPVQSFTGCIAYGQACQRVSQLHGEVSRKMWNKFSGICEIKAITNAQNWHYWADKQLYNYIDEHKLDAFIDRKWYPEKRAMDIVADQTGKLF